MSYEGNILFGRRYRLIVGTGKNLGIDVSELRCVFKIEKSMTDTPNYSEITIFNLSPQTENTLILSGQRVVLEAGYEGDQYGLIFDGDVVQPIRDKEDNTTYKLTLISQDGDLFYNSGIVNASYRAGQSQRIIAGELVTKASNPVSLGSISSNLDNIKLARGKAVFGLARDYLRQIAKSQQAAFYINDRQVNIVKAEDLPTGRIISLTPQTGLVGALEQNDDGVNGKCLMNPLITLNSFLHVDNSYVRIQKKGRDGKLKQLDQDGVYRVIKLTHSGDTRGDSWYTEFTAITQTGTVPNIGKSLR